MRIRAAAFMVVAALHVSFFAVINLMKDITSTACLHGWYHKDRCVENCRRLLGPFGDLRFYYAVTMAMLSLTLTLTLALRRSSPRV
jgi:hypothetical protein